MLNVRMIKEADFEAVAELTARVFSPDDVESYRDLTLFAMRSCPFMKPEHCYIGEIDDRIVAKWQGLDFDLRLGATSLRAVGLQALAADRDDRGKGYPQALVHEVLAKGVHLEFDLFLGFAKKAAFYRRLGGVPFMAEYWWTQKTRRVGRLGDDPFWPMRDDDLPAFLEHYERYSATRPGSMQRSEAYWPWMIRKPDHILMHDDGYLGYRVLPDRVELREVAGDGEAFFDAVLRKLGDVARAEGIDQIAAHIPVDHPLVLLSAGQGASIEIEYPVQAGGFAMIANFERFPRKLVPELEARLARSTCRDSRVQLDVHCGGASNRLELGPPTGAPRAIELPLSPGGLLQLAFGYRPARAILWQEGLRLDEGDAPLLDALFPAAHPFMWHTDRF